MVRDHSELGHAERASPPPALHRFPADHTIRGERKPVSLMDAGKRTATRVRERGSCPVATPGSNTSLARDAIGLREVLFQSVTHMAPAAAVAFSIRSEA